MHSHGVLHKFITIYPKSYVEKWGIPRDKVVSLIFVALFQRYITKVVPVRWRRSYCVAVQKYYAVLVAWIMPKKSDIIIAWSGNALPIIKKAKRLNIISILECGSTHAVACKDLLSSEYNKQGLPRPVLNSPKTTELELLEYEEADYIAIPSNFVKKTFLKHLVPEEKLLLNAYGVDLHDFKAVKKEDDVFRIIHCGGICIRKGVPYLLQAFFELDLPNSELWLIGKMNNEILPFMEKYASAKIFHKGAFPQRELYKYYSQANVFSINSIEEGLSMVQLQAMACGLPLLCTENTGGGDLITDGVEGYKLPVGNLEMLKEKLLYLYNNPEKCSAMGKAAMEKVATGFSWNDYGNRYFNNMEKIFKKGMVKEK